MVSEKSNKTIFQSQDLDNSTYLYKYLPIIEEKLDRLEQIFINNEIFFSSPKRFNDPFDCLYHMQYTTSEAVWKNYYNHRCKKNMPELNRQQRRQEVKKALKSNLHKSVDFIKKHREGMQEDINKLGVCSLSTIPDNILMWSHYSYGHTGICLQFNASKGLFVFAKRINYKKEFPVVYFPGDIFDEKNIWNLSF
jgi:hypothetical protein